MAELQKLKKIAFIGNYPPRKCGIATFTYDLRNAVRNQYPQTECVVLALNDKDQDFRPIGSDGWYKRNGIKANFDQQPIVAYETVSGCIDAFKVTEDYYWYNKARIAFEWFLGRNDLGLPLYDPMTGGCYDALHVDRVNLNEGAESTLSFLLSLAEMHRIENLIKSYEHVKSYE